MKEQEQEHEKEQDRNRIQKQYQLLVPFVVMQEYQIYSGIEELPSLVYFENGVPEIFEGKEVPL